MCEQEGGEEIMDKTDVDLLNSVVLQGISAG
jgi:hypothetical protein